MAELFKNNQYPQVLFKAQGPTLTVNTVNEYKQALADGWSPTHIAQEYPKWVRNADGVKVLCADATEEAAVAPHKAEKAEHVKHAEPAKHPAAKG